MADYKQMYATLFRGITKAIHTLLGVQQETEDMFIESEDAPLLKLLRSEEDRITESDSDSSTDE